MVEQTAAELAGKVKIVGANVDEGPEAAATIGITSIPALVFFKDGKEVHRIVDEAYDRARKTLTDHIDELHAIAKGLLEYESLSGDEINSLLRGEPILRNEPEDTPPPPKRPAGKRSSVPTGGNKGGLDPEPQPGT